MDAPEILAKGRIDVATTFDEGAVFHMAQQRPIDEARSFVRDSERRFVARARADLAAFVGALGVKVAGATLVAPAPKPVPPFEVILKSHPLIHAAEGELYRRVFAEACAALGAPPKRVPADVLVSGVSAAARLTPANTAAHLALMGKASGKPWAADQKQAALAAWLRLAGG